MNILLVEDDKFDAFVTRHYLKKGHLHYRLTVVHNGAEAFKYLEGQGRFKHSPQPDLILLDIGLPDMDGRDVLKRLHEDERYKDIPALILTGQSLEGDPVRENHLFEHAYMNKWVNMEEFLSFVKAVDDAHPASSPHN